MAHYIKYSEICTSTKNFITSVDDYYTIKWNYTYKTCFKVTAIKLKAHFKALFKHPLRSVMRNTVQYMSCFHLCLISQYGTTRKPYFRSHQMQACDRVRCRKYKIWWKFGSSGNEESYKTPAECHIVAFSHRNGSNLFKYIHWTFMINWPNNRHKKKTEHVCLECKLHMS